MWFEGEKLFHHSTKPKYFFRYVIFSVWLSGFTPAKFKIADKFLARKTKIKMLILLNGPMRTESAQKKMENVLFSHFAQIDMKCN